MTQQHLERLPDNVLRRLTSDNLTRQETSEHLIKVVGDIVATTDKSQAVKGILTAGARKTVVYSLAKLRKMFKSLNKK